MLCIHAVDHPQLQPLSDRDRRRSPQRANGARASCCSTCSTACAGPSILIHPAGVDVVSNTLMMFLMLLVVAVSSMLAASLPIAALAATAPVTAGDRAQLRAERHLRQLRAGGARGRRRRLFRAARPPAAFDDAGDAGSARRKGRADRRARTGQGDLRRGAPSRRSRQRRQVALPRADEPRTAHAAERHPRLFRGDEERDLRRPCRAGLQGLFRRHPQFRRPPAQPHQRDPRSVADRGRPLRAQRGSGLAGARRRRLPSSVEAARLQPRHHHPRGVRARHAAALGRRARDPAGRAQSACRTPSSSRRRAARSG